MTSLFNKLLKEMKASVEEYEDTQIFQSFDSTSSNSDVDLDHLINQIRLLKATNKEKMRQALKEFMAKHGFDLEAGDKLFVPDDPFFSNQWLRSEGEIPGGIEVSQFLPADKCYLVKMSAINNMRWLSLETWKHDLLGNK